MRPFVLRIKSLFLRTFHLCVKVLAKFLFKIFLELFLFDIEIFDLFNQGLVLFDDIVFLGNLVIVLTSFLFVILLKLAHIKRIFFVCLRVLWN